MMKASMKDLRYHTKEIMAAVDRGETVTITRRGKAAAQLSPLKGATKKSPGKNPMFGIWKDRADLDDVAKYVRKLRAGRKF
jgi:prevent-host-death family protein